jgi:dTDP-4-dehydrorhamnose reductase
MRVLIIGSNGLLGKDMVEDWTGDEIIPATSRDADIRELAQVRQLVASEHPDWIILTAGYTDVDGSEQHQDLAFAVNRDGARNVAIAAREFGAKLCYLSTDYVFDGTANRPYEPEDPIHPLNIYGASKAAGEKAVQEHAGHWLIARTSWLFGAARPSFPEKILQAADFQPELSRRARHPEHHKLGNMFLVRICRGNSTKGGPERHDFLDYIRPGRSPRQAPRLLRFISKSPGFLRHRLA